MDKANEHGVAHPALADLVLCVCSYINSFYDGAWPSNKLAHVRPLAQHHAQTLCKPQP